MVISKPVLSQIATNSPLSGGAELLMMGLHFGYRDFSNTAALGTVACVTTSWRAATAVRCKSSLMLGYPDYAQITTHSMVGTAQSVFSFDAPILSHVAGNTPATGGAVLDLEGSNFGPTDYTVSARLADDGCASSSWVTQSLVTCTTGYDPSISNAASLTVVELVGCSSAAFSFDAAVVTHVALNDPQTGGASLTVSGFNFGARDFSLTVRADTLQCAKTAWTAATALVCSTSANHLRDSRVVAIGFVTGTAVLSITYDSPVLTFIAPKNAATTGALSVTVHGFNFGAGAPTATVVIAVTTCATAVWVSTTEVKCGTSAGIGANRHVKLLASLGGTLLNGFTFDAPVLTDSTGLTNTPGSASASSVTILGLGFSLYDPSASASVGGARCQTTEWISATSLGCLSSAGAASSLVVTIDGNVGCGQATFSFDSPVVTGVHPANVPNSAGGVLSVTGTNFGSLDFSASARLGERPCESTVWRTITTILCTHGQPTDLSLEHAAVTINRVAATLARAFTFDSPVLSHVLPMRNIAASGGGYVTVSGLGFGRIDFSATTKLGGKDCLTSLWMSTTSVICKAATLRDSASVHTVGALVGTSLKLFTFDAPIMSSRAGNVPTSGAGGILVMAY